jgi:hypothetical protein
VQGRSKLCLIRSCVHYVFRVGSIHIQVYINILVIYVGGYSFFSFVTKATHGEMSLVIFYSVLILSNIAGSHFFRVMTNKSTGIDSEYKF